MFHNHPTSLTFNKIEYQKYSKQIILENIGINGQKRLKQAKILIIGLGGLGCPALIYLATSGIGNIGIVEHDIINISNLNRQILYNIENINENKIDCAYTIIQKINKECKIKLYNQQFNKLIGNKITQKYDIIIDATDNFKTRYIIDDICYKLHKIHIYGAINKYEGHISVFNYKNHLRYNDLYPESLNLQELNCEDNGVLGIMSGTIGILQATEAIKIILGIGTIINGTILKYNLLTTSFNHIKVQPNKRQYSKIITQHNKNNINNIINIQEIYYIGSEKFIVIDIRNKIDFQNDHIDKAINIPVKYFQAKQTINFINSYYKIYKIIITCNKLTTSLNIANLLNNYKIKTYILNRQE